MDSQKEALLILDQSLERLQHNIERIKKDKSLLQIQNKENEGKIAALEHKKDSALKELYDMREMIARELHWNVDKTIKNKRNTPPLILMKDDDTPSGKSHE